VIGYTYSDAYKLLGGKSKILKVLDALVGSGLVVGAGVAPTPVLAPMALP